MSLIDFLREECRCFFLRSCSPFPIRLFHAGDDDVLPSSPTETSPHHCAGILRDTSVPGWKQWLRICRTQPQGWQSCAHPKCAHEQLFVWYSSHALFFSADIIIYQAEVLQIHCTTTVSKSLCCDAEYAKDGTVLEVSVSRCEDCSDCPYRSVCCKTKDENRRKEIYVCWEFQKMRQQFYQNITTEEGKLLRCNRSIQAEGTFGQLKHNRSFKRFLTGGTLKFWQSYSFWGFLRTLLISFPSTTEVYRNSISSSQRPTWNFDFLKIEKTDSSNDTKKSEGSASATWVFNILLVWRWFSTSLCRECKKKGCCTGFYPCATAPSYIHYSFYHPFYLPQAAAAFDLTSSSSTGRPIGQISWQDNDFTHPSKYFFLYSAEISFKWVLSCSSFRIRNALTAATAPAKVPFAEKLGHTSRQQPHIRQRADWYLGSCVHELI